MTDTSELAIETERLGRERQLRVLELCAEGDAVLRERCRRLSREEIRSKEIQGLIDNMKYTCDEKKYGVGLSANQVGEAVAISVIAIKPTPSRPNLEVFDQVCINTEIVETFGEPELMWEGCVSTAMDKNGEPAMAQVPRFAKVRAKYLDRDGEEHDEIAEGFVAQVLQHETDHLNGVLFTDLIGEGELVSNKEYRRIIMEEKK